MGAKALEVNFDVIDAKRVANGLSQRDFGELIGRSTGWYCMSKRRGSMYKEDIEAVANLLGLKVAELIPRAEEPKDVPIIKIVKKEGPKVETPVEEPKVDSMELILAKVSELSDKVDKLTELLSALSNPDAVVGGFENNKPRHVIAQEILAQLVEEGNGKCRKTKFVELLLKEGIGSSYVKEAIKGCGFEEAVVGFGNNTTTWILDTVG